MIVKNVKYVENQYDYVAWDMIVNKGNLKMVAVNDLKTVHGFGCCTLYQ